MNNRYSYYVSTIEKLTHTISCYFVIFCDFQLFLVIFGDFWLFLVISIPAKSLRKIKRDTHRGWVDRLKEKKERSIIFFLQFLLIIISIVL